MIGDCVVFLSIKFFKMDTKYKIIELTIFYINTQFSDLPSEEDEIIYYAISFCEKISNTKIINKNEGLVLKYNNTYLYIIPYNSLLICENFDYENMKYIPKINTYNNYNFIFSLFVYEKINENIYKEYACVENTFNNYEDIITELGYYSINKIECDNTDCESITNLSSQ